MNKPQNETLSILIDEHVTGGGFVGQELIPSWAVEGRAMRRALVNDFASVPGVRVVATLDRRFPAEDAPGVIVHVVGPGDGEVFERLVREVDCTLIVAPETARALELRARTVERLGGRSIGSTVEAIGLTADKPRLARHFRALGIATPPTVHDPDWVGPVVVKPADGAGAWETFRRSDVGSLPPGTIDDPTHLVQPFRPGVAMSASYLVDITGQPTLIAIGRQRVKFDDAGRISYQGGIVPEPIDVPEDVDRAIASVPGLLGVVGVDFLMDGDRAEVLEINPRPTTSIVGLTAILPPGTIAGAWLAAGSGGLEATDWPARLAVARSARPVRFDADGTIGTVRWLALDIGGANLKAAHSDGHARSTPFELWKAPDDLPKALASSIAGLPEFDRLALTMTAELCDCYPTKSIGVNAILDATIEAIDRHPSIWGTDGRFHNLAEIRRQPSIAAASNWLALATLAARLMPAGPGLLIDVGSTTTDLIPTFDGKVVVRGRTDTERLQTGELVYAGVRRTPVCALANMLTFRGVPTRLMAELFATTLDVYLTLGDISQNPFDLSTADGRPATLDASLDRLARMVGADREGFGSADALAFAQAIDDTMMARLVEAAAFVKPRHVVVSGSGEFLARRVANRLVEPGGSIVSISTAWGPVASSAACAHALAVLAGEGGLGT